MNDVHKALADMNRALAPEMELLRRKYRRWLMTGVALIVALVTVYILATGNFSASRTLSVIFNALIPSFLLYHGLNHFYRKEGKARFMNALMKATGLAWNPNGVFTARSAAAHKILPPFREEYTGDGFQGEYDGVHIMLQETRLDDPDPERSLPKGNRKEQRRDAQVFNGVLIRLSVRKPFEGHTVIMPDNALLTWFRTKFSQFQPVNLVSNKFEKKYDVMGTDQVEARVILNPAFMERFMEAGEVLRARWMEVSFLGNEILFAVARTGALFEWVPLWQPVTENVLKKGAAELESVFKVIDVLRLNPQVGI